MKGGPGSVVLVTGASRGIGAATARLAAARGYDVCVNYRTHQAAAERVVADIRSGRPSGACRGGRRRAARPTSSVCSRPAIAELGRPTALVNNAGMLETQMRVEHMERRAAAARASPPTSSARSCARAKRCGACRRSRGGPGGAIVNVSSMAARLGAPGEYVDYAASKGAVETLTIGLAREVADEGIRVNAVRPGVDLHRHPRQRRRAGPRRSRQGDGADAARRRRPRKSRAPSSGCSPTRRRTPPARSSTSRGDGKGAMVRGCGGARVRVRVPGAGVRCEVRGAYPILSRINRRAVICACSSAAIRISTSGGFGSRARSSASISAALLPVAQTMKM